MATSSYLTAVRKPLDRPGVIAVRFDRVYGNVVCYPVSEAAQKFAEIARTKTLSPFVLGLAQDLGFRIEVDQGSIETLTSFLIDGAARA